MFSSRSCKIRALPLLKKNKEENTITYQESPPWLPTMFKTPCVETILYPEFLRSNRQAKISGRTIDARNYRPLLTSSPAYYNFLETTENYTLQIQRKNRVCLSRSRVSTRPRVPASHVSESHVPESHASESHVSESHVSESHVFESHVPESHVPESHVPESQSPHPHPTFGHNPETLINKDECQYCIC